MHQLLYPLIIATLLLASACATTPGSGQAAGRGDNGADHGSEANACAEPEGCGDPHYPVRPFPTQTLYSLLAAELAGTRGQFDYSLRNYRHEAHKTRDVGVIARATRIAHYLEDPIALAEMSNLWVEVDPNNIEARELAVFAHLVQNQIDEAFVHARFLLEQGHGDAVRRLPASASRLPEENRRGLLAAYLELATNHPDSPDALFGYTLLLWQLEELPQALSAAEKLAALEPDNETVLLLEAQLLKLNKRDTQALDKLEAAFKQHPDSEKVSQQYLRQLFSNPDLSISEARLRSFSKRHPDNEDFKFGLALIYREQGNSAAANTLLQTLAATSSRPDEARYQLGLIAESSEQNEQAEGYYRAVKDRHILAATSRLTQLMAKRDDLDGAREYLQNLRNEDPDIAVRLYQIEAELLMRKHSYQPAHTLLSEGLGRYPNDMDLLYTRSLASEKLLNISAVEADLRLVLEQDADNPAALNALGYSLANHTTRYEEAQSLIEKALSFSPDDPATIDSLGWVLYRRGLHTQALAHLRQAANILPDAEISAHLGEVLWVNGEHEEARAILAKALQDSPKHPVLLETIERLKVDFD
ncbi:MAG: tetratricopeptide repeat protein [Porticoccaceae bacterium]